MQEFYNELCINLMDDFNKLKEDINIDVVHNLRVNFKKLKAFYKIFSFIDSDFKFKSNFKKNKKLYKILGKHRDNQILSIHLNNFIELDNKDYLIEKFLIKNKNFKPFLSSYNNINYNDILNYLDYLIESIDLNDRELHDQRKLIKDYYYISSWIGKQEEAEIMKNVSDYLGEWHDRENVINNIINVEFFPDNFIINLEAEEEYYLNLSKKEIKLFKNKKILKI